MGHSVQRIHPLKINTFYVCTKFSDLSLVARCHDTTGGSTQNAWRDKEFIIEKKHILNHDSRVFCSQKAFVHVRKRINFWLAVTLLAHSTESM